MSVLGPIGDGASMAWSVLADQGATTLVDRIRDSQFRRKVAEFLEEEGLLDGTVGQRDQLGPLLDNVEFWQYLAEPSDEVPSVLAHKFEQLQVPDDPAARLRLAQAVEMAVYYAVVKTGSLAERRAALSHIQTDEALLHIINQNQDQWAAIEEIKALLSAGPGLVRAEVSVFHGVPDRRESVGRDEELDYAPSVPLAATNFDAFVSHSRADGDWVEELASRLEDQHGFKVWLDRWTLIPGKPWQQEMAKGIETASTCVVVVGSSTPAGWFEQEVHKALNRQAREPNFRVIPVLAPGARQEAIPDFVELRTWADLSGTATYDSGLHVLVCGIKGIAPGRYDAQARGPVSVTRLAKAKLEEFNQHLAPLVGDELVNEMQRKILYDWHANAEHIDGA